jgi:DNA-binding transcriptional LysR family regulator
MKTLRRRLPNANALLVFECAARWTSFTKAADELSISQPAVTRHVRTLEAELGCALFERRHNRLALTADGLRLWRSVTAGFHDMAGVMDIIRAEEARERLVVATHSGFAQQWLMPRFSDLSKALQNFDLQLMISDQEADLDRGAYDLAIRIGDRAGQRRRGGHSLIRETVFPVASPAFLAANPTFCDAAPAALTDAPLLHMDEGDQPWLTWRGWFRAQDVGTPPRRPDVLYTNYPLVLQAALAGRGIALAWRPLTDGLIAQGSLVPVGPMVEDPNTGYYLAWSADSPVAAFAPVLCDWFDAQIAASDGG